MKKIGSGVLSLVVVFMLLEGLCRVGSTFVREPARNQPGEWYRYSPQLGWERRPGFKGIVTTAERSFDAEGYLDGDAAKLADPKTKKILFIGDSNTFGNELPPDKIFSALVDDLLGEAVSINAAVPGYSSYQGKELLKKTLQKFRPDVIVASFNYNDRRYVLKQEDVDGVTAFQRMSALAQRKKWMDIVNKIYIARAVRFVLSSAGLTAGEPAEIPIALEALAPRVSPENYRLNLTEIAETARRQDIPLLFLVLGDNPIQTFYLYRGIELLERAQADSATEYLRIAKRETTLFTVLAQRYLEQAYRSLGNGEEARKVSLLERPYRSAHGGNPVRLDREYQRIMREVGEKYQTGVVDGAKALEQRPSVYYDFCHFDPTGHRMVAEILATRIRTVLGSTRDDGPGESRHPGN